MTKSYYSKTGAMPALILAMLLCLPLLGRAQFGKITNDVFWNTANGQPLYSQGGGIFKFTDPATNQQKYYWYGAKYREAEVYRNNPSVTLKDATFDAVTCYTSTNLVSWTFESYVLTKEAANPDGKSEWMGRLGVAYVPQMKKYAMFIQHGNKVMVAVSDTPTGNFTPHNEIDMISVIGTHNTGDQTVFTDEDTGKSYLIYSYGSGRDKIYVSEIGVKDGNITILDCARVFEGQNREGNCLFKYGGKYYMCASNIYGWDSSHAYYLVADDIRGPYTPTNDMMILNGAHRDYAHVSQTGFFFTVKGSQQETVIYCGDRWADFAGNGLGYNVWVPLSFNGDVPYFNSLSSWNIDAQTGSWSIAADNNYALNGSFEADRNKIPSEKKPVQEQLTGWETKVIRGNSIAVGSVDSPVLNYFNTAEDRKTVIGEKSLNITDTKNFKRRIWQEVTATETMPLPDGVYTLKAVVKNTGGFKMLRMYAKSSDKECRLYFGAKNTRWRTITLKEITVRGGRAEIGFEAIGKAGASCQIDDVTFTRK